MADTTNLMVDASRAISVGVQNNTTVTLTAVTGDPLYYGPSSGVSPDQHAGILNKGDSKTFTAPQWIISQGLTSVAQTTTQVQGTGQIGAYEPGQSAGTFVGKISYYNSAGELVGFVPVYK